MKTITKIAALVSLIAFGSSIRIQAMTPSKEVNKALHKVFGSKNGNKKRAYLKGTPYEDKTNSGSLNTLKEALKDIDFYAAYDAAGAKGKAIPTKDEVWAEVYDAKLGELDQNLRGVSAITTVDIGNIVDEACKVYFEQGWKNFKNTMDHLTNVKILDAYKTRASSGTEPTKDDLWAEVRRAKSEHLAKRRQFDKAKAETKVDTYSKPQFEAQWPTDENTLNYLKTLGIQTAYDDAKRKKGGAVPTKKEVWNAMKDAMSTQLIAAHGFEGSAAAEVELKAITKPLFNIAWATFTPAVVVGPCPEFKKKPSNKIYWIVAAAIGGGLAYWLKVRQQKAATKVT